MSEPLTFGSLFAGVGGFDLGFERAGMVCRWQVEIDPFCCKVLKKHWPNVRRWNDVRTFMRDCAAERVDVICGGFPCQDISNAGKRTGIDGERSGLWAEFARVIRLLRPRYVVVENVAALLNRGVDRVLGDLAACGYDAEWDCIPAASVGAPHIRDRLFIIGIRDGPNAIGKRIFRSRRGLTLGKARKVQEEQKERQWLWANATAVDSTLPDPDGQGLEKWQGQDAAGTRSHRWSEPCGSEWWSVEPDVGRVADGVPKRVDRLRSLGNAVVPQIAQWIGNRIIEAHKATTCT